MRTHLKWRGCVDPAVQGFVDGQLEIDDRSALLADEVVVLSDVGIEAVEGAPEVDLADQLLVQKDVQVPVDRPHAEIREFLLELIVDPVGSGMPARAPQELQDSFPLPAPLVPAAVPDSPRVCDWSLLNNIRNYS